MRNARWGIAAAGAAIAVFLLSAATAWACVSGPTLKVSPDKVKPGEVVNLSGFNYNDGPIVIHFNSLTGPVLGTFAAVEGRFSGSNDALVASVTIPADTAPGTYVLIALQSAKDGSLSQVPTRTLITVTGPDGTASSSNPLAQVDAGRPLGPARSATVGAGALVLVGVGAAGVALFLAGVATFALSRRRGEPETVGRAG